MDADPDFGGAAVYDSYLTFSPWTQEGGTSLACPMWAGLIAIANQGRVAAGGQTLYGDTQTLPALYSLPSSDFNDILSGNNGGHGATVRLRHGHGPGRPRADLARDRPGRLRPGRLARRVRSSRPPVRMLVPHSA